MKPRLLANENLPAPSVRLLRERGYDVYSVAESSGGLSDRDVLANAVAERRWIVTFDLDYGKLIFGRGFAAPPAVVLFRMRSYRPDAPGRLLAGLLDSGSEFGGISFSWMKRGFANGGCRNRSPFETWLSFFRRSNVFPAHARMNRLSARQAELRGLVHPSKNVPRSTSGHGLSCLRWNEDLYQSVGCGGAHRRPARKETSSRTGWNRHRGSRRGSV